MPKMFSIRRRGLTKAVAAMKKAGSKGPKAMGSGLFIEGERIMTVSKGKEVPVASGNLRSTGHVEPPHFGVSGPSVRLGFGGPAAAYALAVHENPRAGKTGGVSPSGKPYPRTKGGKGLWAKVGKSKYLEDPFNRAKKGMDGRLARRIGQSMPETR